MPQSEKRKSVVDEENIRDYEEKLKKISANYPSFARRREWGKKSL